MVFCGIDIGTTNTKAVLLGADGELLDTINTCAQGREKGDKDAEVQWYRHFCRVFDYFKTKGRFSGEEIVCSVTAQGGSFVLLDGQFRPVSRMHSWMENAGTNIVNDLTKFIGRNQFYHITGWQPDGWLTVCKLKKIVSDKDGIQDFKFVSTVPEFIHSQLAGRFVTDIANAQITGMCDFKKARWDEKILNWAGIRRENLPQIEKGLSILLDKVATSWGKISFVTSSHDQYAAMQAAGLKKDKSVMLGTGTAWVINRRTSEPLFDDKCSLSHPGRDICGDCFGNIITLGSIGKGFDKLLKNLGVDIESLAQVEKILEREYLPDAVIKVEINEGTVEPKGDGTTAIRRYMEWVGSKVVFMLEHFGFTNNFDRIVMTGGAAANLFWPQIIADLCNTTVEAADFPEFTAYGAALHAKAAFTGENNQNSLPKWMKSKIYEPSNADEYRQWYLTYQKPLFAEALVNNNESHFLRS